MAITLDKQVVSDHCASCDVDFVVVRGTVYEDSQPFALYLIALHGHCAEGRLGHLAIAVKDPSNSARSIAASMLMVSAPDEIGYVLTEWKSSPWRDETYLGHMLSPEEVQSSPHRATFFHTAEHVVRDLPEVHAYLS
jgi:hypothetical protein